MKTIGLIGGMSWESSAVYYGLVNKEVRKILGGFHSCKSILLTVDFDEIQSLQHIEDWEKLDQIMVKASKTLETAGADLIILCTNTMHLCSPAILKNISIPFLHIAEACGQEIATKNIKKVALLGTKFTMEKDFYKTYIFENFEI
jgi:aspartate racemase